MTTDPFDPAAFQAFAAAIGLQTTPIIDTFGRTDFTIDREGLRQLADHSPLGKAKAHALVDRLLALYEPPADKAGGQL